VAALSALVVSAPAARAGSASGTIATVAGSVGGPASATSVAIMPLGVAVAGSHLYVTDQAFNAVRTINAATDALATVAGSGPGGFSGDGGPATAAELSGPFGAAVDPSGNLVIADLNYHHIRVTAAVSGTFYGQAMTAGDIYTVAGDGSPYYAGDGGPATKAGFDPAGIAVDAAGNIVFADYFNSRIRVVAARSGTFYGQAMTAGDIYTVAGSANYGFAGDGGPATAAWLDDPQGLALDKTGNVVFSDFANARVRVVATTTGTFYGQRMTAGDIYTVAGNGTFGFAGDGGPATAAEFAYVSQLGVDGFGNLIIADGTNGGVDGNDRIRVVASATRRFYGQAMTSGDVYTVAGNGVVGYAGDGGPAGAAELSLGSGGVASDSFGNIVIADAGNDRVRVMAGATGTFYDRAMTAGHIYTIAGNGSDEYSGDGAAATSAQISPKSRAKVDASGNLLIADIGDSRIRVVALTSGVFYGVSMTGGDIYTVAGIGRSGFSGDGGPASAAKLNKPAGVAGDAAGNLLIADTLNDRIRVVAARSGTFYNQVMSAGDIYTVAGDGTAGAAGDGGPATSAQLSQPNAVVADSHGNLLIADANNNRIQVVAASSGDFYGQSMTSGDIYTIAGTGVAGFGGDVGPATLALLSRPVGLTVDASGDVLIADTNNDRVRVVAATSGQHYGVSMVAGDIYTVAGTGSAGFSGDGGVASAARVFHPTDVAVDPAGDLLIADQGNNRARLVAAVSGELFGQDMTAGDIYTVAGDGVQGFSGDGGAGTAAELHLPLGVAFDGSGDAIVSDSGNLRVRLILR
jgi:hypothetical protein